MPSKKTKLSQLPFWLLSLDPAEAAGWALFKEGIPLLWGTADGRSWRTWTEALLVGGVQKDGATKECVIEDGFFQYGKQTFKGTLTLGRRRGLAQAAAEAFGYEKFTFIVPSTWQNGMGWRKGVNTKEWSLALVKERWGIEGITHDIADALALGTYYLDTLKASS